MIFTQFKVDMQINIHRYLFLNKNREFEYEFDFQIYLLTWENKIFIIETMIFSHIQSVGISDVRIIGVQLG